MKNCLNLQAQRVVVYTGLDYMLTSWNPAWTGEWNGLTPSIDTVWGLDGSSSVWKLLAVLLESRLKMSQQCSSSEEG